MDYLQRLLTIDGKDPVKVLRFCFDYLDHPESEVARDAHREFAGATDRAIRQVAKHLPGARLRRWLQDPRTPRELLGLSGLLLGHCGGDQDAALLRNLLQKVTRPQDARGLEGLLSGYILLRPREGWTYLRSFLAPSNDFLIRYAGFRALRSLDTHRPGAVDRKEKLAALEILLDQGDIADFGIEHLRSQHCWDLTKQVLTLHGRESHDHPVIRRSLLRYALQCPAPLARQYVADARQHDPDAVVDAVELLELEDGPQTPGR